MYPRAVLCSTEIGLSASGLVPHRITRESTDEQRRGGRSGKAAARGAANTSGVAEATNRTE